MVEPSSPPLLATQVSFATTKPAAATTMPTPLLPTPTPIFDVLIDNVAISPQGKLYASGYGNDLQHLAQWDGAKWIALSNGLRLSGISLAVDSAGHLYTEFFTDSQPGMSNAIMRWDGNKWEDITGNFGEVVDALKPGRISSNVPVVALAVDGQDNLYAAGSFYYPTADHTGELPMGYVAKWDQEDWSVVGGGFDKLYITHLAVSADGSVYISAEQPLTAEGISSYFAKWDGKSWTPINPGKLNNTQGIALYKSGRLYAYDEWMAIAYWDGTDWTTITDQLGGEAPAVYDMLVDTKGYVYIGGAFEAVSGIPVQNIAYWDGNLWHALGEGLNKQVNALAFHPNGDLYAVGLFTEAGGMSTNHVAYWDGETWHALEP